MTNDNYYGFESTDNVEYDKAGAPVGEYKVMIIGEEPEKNGKGVVAEYEIVDGIYKGKKFKQWLNTLQGVWAKKQGMTGEDLLKAEQTGHIAQQTLKRIADATGKAVSATSPLKGRVLRVVVAQQKNNPNYTEIKKYISADSSDAPF